MFYHRAVWTVGSYMYMSDNSTWSRSISTNITILNPTHTSSADLHVSAEHPAAARVQDPQAAAGEPPAAGQEDHRAQHAAHPAHLVQLHHLHRRHRLQRLPLSQPRAAGQSMLLLLSLERDLYEYTLWATYKVK